jgi:2-hydroxycyclohexanecarboxyl-CoA dehydrogenase
MIETHGGGRVVNVVSDAGRVGSAGESVYAGAKGGVIALTKSLVKAIPLRRLARPDEVAAPVLFFASEAASSSPDRCSASAAA